MEYRTTKDWPFHISCGGAVYREERGVRRYAVLYRGERFGPYGNSWHLPKGTLDSRETLEQCAYREIREESGLVVKIEGYLGALQDAWRHPEKGLDIDKTTHYFLCRHLSGDGSAMDREHDELQWLEAAEAIERLSKVPKQEEKVIERAERYLKILIAAA